MEENKWRKKKKMEKDDAEILMEKKNLSSHTPGRTKNDVGT